MEIDADIIEDAINFLLQGGEAEAARTLKECTFMAFESNDSWMDGNRRLDGIDIELSAPRKVYEKLSDSRSSVTKAIRNAFNAVMPVDTYLKAIHVRAISKSAMHQAGSQKSLSESSRKRLLELLDVQKSTMIAVSTGGPKINTVNHEYTERQREIKQLLSEVNVDDPNPFSDLWAWYGKWSDGSLPTYQSRRQYIGDIFTPLIDSLSQFKKPIVEPAEPTGWARVDRNVDKITSTLESAQNEEDFQAVGLHCREALISLSQEIYSPEKHPSSDGVSISKTDSKRMLDAYIVAELPGETNEYLRKHAKAAVDLAVNLQHKRTALFRDAALCAEATRSIINIITILSGRGDPDK
jgi:hypothetical protein